MFILYDLIFLLFSVFLFPAYLFRGKFHRGFLARLGVLPKNIQLHNPIWIHAVSVGEAMMMKSLLEELRLAYPGKKFVISTVTPTGNKIARTMARLGDLVTYLPLDFSFIVRGVIKKVKPCLFIIAETELWPNLVSCLFERNIPVVVVNGRISDNSFKGYRAIKILLQPTLNKISKFCVQGEVDRQRLLVLGVSDDKIRISGNMKFDMKVLPDKDNADYRLRLGVQAQDKLFLAGSTHPKEEEIVLDAYKQLLADFTGLRLLIAPRHPERSAEVAELARASGFRVKLISEIVAPVKECRSCPAAVFILDTIGQLVRYYAVADIVFVGGSLIKKGGHNILEPAALGKPVIFGPHMFNFRDISALFLRYDACIRVADAQGLLAAVRGLLNTPSRAEELSKRAQKLIAENQGATRRNIQIIGELFPGEGLISHGEKQPVA